jgi:putative cardiolipin synthase
MRLWQRAALCFALAATSACTMSEAMRREATSLADELRDDALSCPAGRPGACATPSPYQELALDLLARTAGQSAPHAINLLDAGADSLALRIHLIRSARESIEVQAFIFANDDVGVFMLSELVSAARRGVKVRVLVDQLFSIDNRELLAKLARAHVNFELRVYNPIFEEATTQPLEFAAGIICCFLKMNERAHNKLLLIDRRIAIVGGRNVEDRYFDLDPDYNYRDRDVLVIGAEGRVMRDSFDVYWKHRRSRPLVALRDVAERIIRAGSDPPVQPAPRLQHPEEIERAGRLADDAAFIGATFFAKRFEVARVDYFADPPRKNRRRHQPERADVSQKISDLIGGARGEVVMQTPYLILSDPGREAFLRLRSAHPDLRVIVSTNSLAATDAFPVYAISHKHRRLHLQKLGFEIYEYKPFEGRSDAVFRGENPRLSLLGSARALGTRSAVPLKRSGPRRGLHAKSIVIDGHISLIGSHNFDPRSHGFNTENGVIVWDRAFAAALRDSILADTRPNQSWVVARKQDKAVLTPINQTIETISEKLPFFDVWLWRYATSYELRPECAPLRPSDPAFHQCYVRVGDFPEVNLSVKAIYTRLVTAFGGGLAPIL